ncbi:hypothetical protein E4U42_002234 [Claviceps africana]|uniref:Uncharacterized protein n=1 Tax=Claviceps africana TaxID=83212 RepID=A0A8K0JDC7_9HYPO|nr:hypothetical protein E4U42_002234 [Claviceps africana]
MEDARDGSAAWATSTSKRRFDEVVRSDASTGEEAGAADEARFADRDAFVPFEDLSEMTCRTALPALDLHSRRTCGRCGRTGLGFLDEDAGAGLGQYAGKGSVRGEEAGRAGVGDAFARCHDNDDDDDNDDDCHSNHSNHECHSSTTATTSTIWAVSSQGTHHCVHLEDVLAVLGHAASASASNMATPLLSLSDIDWGSDDGDDDECHYRLDCDDDGNDDARADTLVGPGVPAMPSASTTASDRAS